MGSLTRLGYIAGILAIAIMVVFQVTPKQRAFADGVSAETEALAADLTALFRAYRATITKHKDAIHKPGEYFTADNIDKRVATMHKQARVLYKVATKKKYPADSDSAAGKVRKSLESGFERVLREFVSGKLELNWTGDNKYVSKWDGKMLPARFAANAAKYFNEMTGGKVTIKLTTSNQLLVNKANAPDAWESKMIEEKLLNTNKVTGKPQVNDSGDQYRYLLPEFYGKGCIGCHGTTGDQEGYKIHPSKIARKIGDFAGAISVTFRNN